MVVEDVAVSLQVGRVCVLAYQFMYEPYLCIIHDTRVLYSRYWAQRSTHEGMLLVIQLPREFSYKHNTRTINITVELGNAKTINISVDVRME